MVRRKQSKPKSKNDSTSGWERASYFAFHLLAFLLPLTLFPFSYDNFDLPKTVLFEVFVAFIFACWLGGLAVSKVATVKRSSLDVLVLAFLAITLVATIFSPHLSTSLFGKYERYEGLSTVLTYVVVFFLTVQIFRDTQRMRSLRETIIVTTTLVSLYGLIQYLGLDFVPWGEQSFEATRAASTFGNPVLLAGYLVMVLPLTATRFWEEENKGRALFYAFSSFVTFAALLVTFSRGGWVAFLVSAIFLVATQGKRFLNYRILALGLSFFVILLALALIGSAISSTEPYSLSIFERAKSAVKIGEGSIATRLLIWQSALKIIKDKPWLGYGPDTFHLTYPPRGTLRYAQLAGRWNQPDNAHNYLLQLGSTTGLLGLWGFLSIVIYLVWYGTSVVLKHKGKERLLFCGLLAGIIAYIVHLQFSINVVDSGVTFWLLLGLIFAPYSREVTISKGAFLSFAFIALLVTLLILGWSLGFLVADMHFLKAEENASYGLSDVAIQEYQKAIKLNPYQNLYLISLGRLYADLSSKRRNREFFTQAENAYLEGQRRNPQELDNYVFLGDLYLKAGDRETRYLPLAETQFRKALTIYPYWADTHSELGLLYLKGGRFKSASQEFSRSIEIDPREASSYLYLGKSLEGQGKFREAAQAYQLAVERDADNQEAREALSRIESKKL